MWSRCHGLFANDHFLIARVVHRHGLGAFGLLFWFRADHSSRHRTCSSSTRNFRVLNDALSRLRATVTYVMVVVLLVAHLVFDVSGILWLRSECVWRNWGSILFLKNSSRSSANCRSQSSFIFLSDWNGGISGRKLCAHLASLGVWPNWNFACTGQIPGRTHTCTGISACSLALIIIYLSPVIFGLK